MTNRITPKNLPDEYCQRCGRLIYPKYRCHCGVRDIAEELCDKNDGALKRMGDDDMTEYYSAQLTGSAKQRVKIRKLHVDATIPTYAHEGDAGFDICASEDVIIAPGETVKVPTGIAVSVPKGYEAQVRPRSGVTVKTKLRTQLGTIDSGFTGEIHVIVDNIAHDHDFPTTDEIVLFTDGAGARMAKEDEIDGSYHIRKGDRIAQCVLAPISTAEFIEVDSLDESERSDKGFGSSGVRNTKEG